MNNKYLPGLPLGSVRITVIMVAVGSCIAGSIAALLGGIPAAAVTAVALGLLGAAAFTAVDKFVKRDMPAAVISAKGIPSDRIDELTGLANENGLMAWFAEKGGRIASDGKGIIVLTADLADFSAVEKTYGREIAEAVIKEVASRVATCTGADGIAARTSGQEFAAIATVVPLHSAEAAAEQAGKLTELIQRPVELPTGVVWIGGSVGAADGKVTDGPGVLARAREALAKAQRLGRGHFVVYKP